MDGRRVLDMFCYTGGFSLAAAAGRAREVLGSIPASRRWPWPGPTPPERPGQRAVRERRRLRHLARAETAGERFDGVVLDPPKFARSRGAVDDALRAYDRLNRLAVDVLSPGGILVTCSCSGHVTREDFLHARRRGPASGRDIQVLELRAAAADHPDRPLARKPNI